MARLRLVMSDTAEISMSLVPALTFLVWSVMSSTSTETLRTPYVMKVESMQRNASEKPVMLCCGTDSGPLRMACVSCATCSFGFTVAQPAASAVMTRAQAKRVDLEFAFMVASASVLAAVAGVDDIAGDNHRDFSRCSPSRSGRGDVADVHVAATAASGSAAVKHEFASVAELGVAVESVALGLGLCNLRDQCGIEVARFDVDGPGGSACSHGQPCAGDE